MEIKRGTHIHDITTTTAVAAHTYKKKLVLMEKKLVVIATIHLSLFSAKGRTVSAIGKIII